MWPFSAIKNWRWKNAAIALMIAFSLMASNKAAAKISPKTKAVEMEIMGISLKIEKNQLLTEEEERKFPEKIVEFIKLLALDVIADLKEGNLEDATKEYRKMISTLEALTDVGKKSHVNAVKKSFAGVKAEIKELLKDKDEHGAFTVADIPLGQWIFDSKKNFFLYIKIFSKGGKKYVMYQRGGFPLEKGEWAKASKGKPAVIIRYVAEKVLKVKDPKILE